MNFYNQDELLDLVNEYDEVQDRVLRSYVYQNKLTSFRVINGFLINSKGQLWIPRRSLQKKLFPRSLDASVGGHVMAGETYDQAFERELFEELGLHAQKEKCRFIAKFTPHEHDVSAFMHVYGIYTDQEPYYNKADFESAQWYEFVHLRNLLDQGEPAKSDLPKLLALLGKEPMGFFSYQVHLPQI